MDTKKFISSVRSSLTLKDLEKESKKKSLKDLLKKLYIKKASLIQSIKTSVNKQEFQEDLDIISLHIKKGERLLHDLTSKH